jgi:ABC-type antimicrobial peptide transport system permease subunit
MTESMINIIGLSVGMASALLIMLWVQNELHYDNYQPDGNKLFEVKNYLKVDKTDTWVWENSPYQLAEEAVRNVPGIEAVARISTSHYSKPKLNINGNIFVENDYAYVDKGWFKMMHYDLVSGNMVSFSENPYSLILTQSKAKAYFGDQDAVGKIIRIDTTNYQVRAVIKDNPVNSSFQYDVFIPVEAKMADKAAFKNNDMSWGNFSYITFIKIGDHTDKEALAKKLTAIYDKNRKKNKAAAGLLPLSEIHFDRDLQTSQLSHGNHKVVYIFGIMAILLLVIACINYINLTTARASLRVREVSIKKIVGADRFELFMQFFTESVIIILISLILTLIIIVSVFPYFNEFTEKHFPNPLFYAGLWQLLGVTLLSATVLNGVYPAILLSSFNPLSIFSGLNIFKVKNTSLRKSLVVFQFVISIVLIAVTTIIFKQLNFIQQKDASYNRSQVLSFQVPFQYLYKKDFKDADRDILLQSIKHELLMHPAIETVSVNSSSSIINDNGSHSGGEDWDGRDKSFDPTVAKFRVDADFQQIVNLKMVAGRWFIKGSQADKHNVILNETAVNAFNIHKPVIGQRYVSQDDSGVVIGVVKDFSFRSVHDKIIPLIISNNTAYASSFLIKAAPGKAHEAVAAAEKVWNSFVKDDPFAYNFVSDDFDRLYRNDQKASTLIGFFAGVAIIISCLGLFGLATFTALYRTKEIGIRKVLGASVVNIITLISKDFVTLVLIAFIIAIPISFWAMKKWLEDFAYRVDIGPWVFIWAGIVALTIAFISVSSQAVKAAIANPVNSLRNE